jgi:hypothetical protein
MSRQTTWRNLLTTALSEHGESWDDVVSHTLEEGLDTEFDCGHGGEEGESFVLWTKNRVYFSCCYDGAEWADSVPREPCSKAKAKPQHIGG